MKIRVEREDKIQVVTQFGFQAGDHQIWFMKYRRHLENAEVRDIHSDLSFDQYMRKVAEAGITHPDQIGSGVEQYNLGRLGDQGDYRMNNCRFITSNANREEAYSNGKHVAGNERKSLNQIGQTKETSEQYRKISESLKGRSKETDPSVARMAEQLRGRTKANDLSKVSMADKNSKEFVIRDPVGNEYRGKNLKEFCLSHPELERSGMSAMCRGTLSHYKGWTGRFVDENK